MDKSKSWWNYDATGGCVQLHHVHTYIRLDNSCPLCTLRPAAHGGHLTVQLSDGMSCSLCCSILGIYATVTLLAFAAINSILKFTWFLLVFRLWPAYCSCSVDISISNCLHVILTAISYNFHTKWVARWLESQTRDWKSDLANLKCERCGIRAPWPCFGTMYKVSRQ